jgi:hypothetical protein
VSQTYTAQLSRWLRGFEAQHKASTSPLSLFKKLKYRHVQLASSMLAASGVSAVCLALQLCQPTTCSCRQPIQTAATLDFVPTALWPRLHFYSKVAVRMVVLLSILCPLAVLFPLASLHPYARNAWLGLLRFSLRWCGPAFTKWAQWTSARGDLLPADVRSVLETLQNAAPSQSPADTLRILQRSLPMPVDEVFAHFDMEPVGCGAIAAVHRAVLTPKAAALCGIFPDQVSFCA